MTQAATAEKPPASGMALTEKQIAKGKEALQDILVSDAAPPAHVFCEGTNGRVPWYSQAPKNPPPAPVATWTWKDLDMNPNATTPKKIGSVGCGLTSAAMILKYYGYDVDPRKLNEYAQQSGIYGASSNCIADWGKLFKYGGATLSFSRGTSANGRCLSADDTTDPKKVKKLFDLARERARAGKPSIARVFYKCGPPSSYLKGGNHFVVVVGVHRDGHLLSNDPGRFFASLDVGNGASCPDIQDNWIAEDPSKGTSKNGGYVLMRIDLIDGPAGSASSSTASVSATTEITQENWKEVTKQKVEQHLGTLKNPLLQAVRGFVREAVKTAFTGAEVAFDLTADHFDPFRSVAGDAAAQAIKAAQDGFIGNVKQVVTEVTNRLGPVKIIGAGWFKKFIKLPEVDPGAIQTVTSAISAADKILDLEGKIPAFSFAQKLVQAQELLRTNFQQGLGFVLKTVTAPDENGDEIEWKAVSVKPDVLAGVSAAAEWKDVQFKTHAEVMFLFRDLDDLADAILVKALAVLKLIADATDLEGLVAAADKAKLDELVGGRVRIKVNGSASTLDPAELFDALKVEGEARGELVVDFLAGSTPRAEVAVDLRADGQIGVDGTPIEVGLHAVGRLRKDFRFDSIWQSPTAQFKSLMTALAQQPEGAIRVEVSGKTEGKAALGPFQVDADANGKLVVAFDGTQVKLEIDSAGHAEIPYGSDTPRKKVKLALDGDLQCEVTAPPSFAAFWANPTEKLTEMLDSAKLQVEVGAKAGETISVGPFRVTPEAKLTVRYENRAVSVLVAANSPAQVKWGDDTVELAIGAKAGTSVALSDVPLLSRLWTDPQATFDALMDRLIASFAESAKISVTAPSGQSFRKGLLEITPEAELSIGFSGGEVSVIVGANCAITAKFGDNDAHAIDLDIGAQGGASFPIPYSDRPAPSFDEFWEDAEGHLRDVMDRLLQSFRAHARISAKVKHTFSSGFLTLRDGGELVIDVAPPEVALQFDANCLGTTAVGLEQNGQTVPVDFALQGGASLRLDFSGVEVMSGFWDDPDEWITKFVKELPKRLLGTLHVEVSGGTSSIPIGDHVTLSAGGGLSFDFTRTGSGTQDRYDMALRLGGRADVAVAGLATAHAEIALGVDRSGPWQLDLDGKQLDPLWNDPAAALPGLLDAFISSFQGHARVTLEAGGMFGADFPMPAIPRALEDWGIESISVTGGGAARLRLDYWARPEGSYIIGNFNVGFAATTRTRTDETKALRLVVPSSVGVAIKSLGVFRIDGRTVRDLIANPRQNLASVGETIASSLASETTLKLTVNNMIIEANAERMFEAKRCFDRGDFTDGLIALYEGGKITLPERGQLTAEEVVQDGVVLAIALAKLAVWMVS